MGTLSRIFLTFALCISVANAAVNKAPKKTSQANIASIERELNNHQNTLKKITDDLKKYEVALTNNNQKYIAIIDAKKQIEKQIDEMQISLSENEIALRNSMAKANDVLNGVILSAIDNEDDASNLLSQKILEKSLKERLNKLQVALNENQAVKGSLDRLNQSYEQLQQNEADVAELLKQLESDKLVVVKNYTEVAKLRDDARANYKKIKASQYLEKRNAAKRRLAKANKNKKANATAVEIATKFAAPISDFADMNFSKKKGVSFYYNNVQPVTSPESGKVVFKGTVGSFGQVLFIDHGNDVRSVILGHYNPKIEKGMDVKKGDVLGYTEQPGNKIGEIYYEVRKKDIALNTITLLDRNTLAVK